jgi:hypothetical protein
MRAGVPRSSGPVWRRGSRRCPLPGANLCGNERFCAVLALSPHPVKSTRSHIQSPE